MSYVKFIQKSSVLHSDGAGKRSDKALRLNLESPVSNLNDVLINFLQFVRSIVLKRPGTVRALQLSFDLCL